MDFTLDIYRELLAALQKGPYVFQTFEEHVICHWENAIILRHDVDLLPRNSLEFARIQNELGIRGTYYFRAVPESWSEPVIKEIASLGHEIGYHYECLTTCKGDLELGIQDFDKNLNALRKLAPVSTICMHGSPMSKYDSKDLWKTYDYSDYAIIAEPYFDVDFNEVYYMTDTGRKWDGHAASVRDRVQTNFTQTFHSTYDIINAINTGQFLNRVMFTFHPQRWSNNMAVWGKELVLQNVKNVVKKHFYVNN
jgi:hypothetical protein